MRGVVLGARTSLASGNFLHAVESRTCFEPLDLLFVESVIKGDGVYLAILVLDFAFHGLSRCEVLKTKNADLVGRLDLVIV